MDVVVWLRSLGLGKYEAAFRENDIDETVLPSLTHENLKELGVASLGHRVKLLDAIAALRSNPSGNASSMDAATTSRAENPRPEDRAERRQVTVMFSDLVGSTALSARMDPEDMREVISAYQKCVAETVHRFGGFVAKYMGDGVLVYFGYPQAHEDDAERAVRAGLELGAGVGALKTHAQLQTRVGIATGLVVVGDLIGSGASQERAIVGETPNLAARLQGVAEPNSVVIAESTRKLVGNLFELEDLGAQELKGISSLVKAWVALRPSSLESRFDALHASGLTELVGRDEELELLARRWEKAKTREGQVVLLSGEAGIGKSRLTAALMERLTTERHTRLRYLCSPQQTDSAFFPIIGQMAHAAGFTHVDSAQVKLDKLDALLALSSASKQDAALFAEMLSLPNDGRYPTLEMTPQQRRQKTLEALTAQLEALSQQTPILMILEDAHWADPTSLESFGRAVDRIRTLGVLLIVTYRPEFEPSWTGRPYTTALILNRLGEQQIAAIIASVTGNQLLPPSVRRDIIERTDGIPLFVEEMTKAVLEAETEHASRQTAAVVPSVAVPSSLHASLMARLDRLGPAKDVAQIGAAIGREFSHALLGAVAAKPEAELASALDRLIAAGLLFRQGLPPQTTYVFKHALVQDAAYGALLREKRRALHARIAKTLESHFAEATESRSSMLAHHCTEAGLIEKAAGLWGKAAQQSLASSALVEAAAQFARALEQIASLPGSVALRREQIKLQIGLSNALMHVKGYAAPETKSALRQARWLIEQAEARGETSDDPLLLFSVLHGFWMDAYVAFNGDLMHELAAEFLTLAEKRGTTVPLMIAHRMMGNTLLFTGELAEARTRYTQALALYNPAEHRPLATRLGVDLQVSALSFRSVALWLLGYPETARADIDRAVKEARKLGQAAPMMFALANTNYTHILCGDYVAAHAPVEQLVALADETGASQRKAEGAFQRGCVLALNGRAAEAVQTIVSAITAIRSTGATCWTPLRMSCLANAHVKLGQTDDAWRCIGEAMAASKTSKETWCDADLHRVAGEIVLLSGEPDTAKAEAYFERALAIARKQQAKSFELRAATSLARLWSVHGKGDEARDLLASVYGWFTEGFDTPDLKEAKALLDELYS